jgi:hypothetical protein
MADTRWKEYDVVERMMQRTDPQAYATFPALHMRLTKADALIYIQAICSAHGRKVPTMTWRRGGGRAHTDGSRMSLDPNPSLGLVLHELAHTLTTRTSLSKRYRVKHPASGRMVTRRPRFKSNKGDRILHGQVFTDTLAGLIREVC